MRLAAKDVALDGRLGGISTALEPGTLTAICGPNGAGKSSLLEVLAGLTAPDAGSVMLGGRSLAAMHPTDRARALGYLPQEGQVAWDLSVRNLVALARLPHRDRGEEQVEAAITALDLEQLASRPVSTLSGGERARALLARVLAGEPRWILADEPLAALDLAHQQRLLRELRAQASAGVGVVVVVHDLAIARNHADRVLLLDQGRCVADAEPASALSPETIARVFAVEGEWIGKSGGLAFSCYPTGLGKT